MIKQKKITQEICTKYCDYLEVLNNIDDIIYEVIDVRIIKLFKKNFLLIVIISAILIAGVSFRHGFESKLKAINEKKLIKQTELEKAKQRYALALKKMNNASESATKEIKIREKLNMIKEDEIQFSFVGK